VWERIVPVEPHHPGLVSLLCASVVLLGLGGVAQHACSSVYLLHIAPQWAAVIRCREALLGWDGVLMTALIPCLPPALTDHAQPQGNPPDQDHDAAVMH
jgi:hypothetical protein